MLITLANQHLTRQADIIPDAVRSVPITIIGAGAIGSFTALSLAKAGFTNMTVYDFDTVDVVNLSSQFYRHTDIGKPKVQALKELIYDFTGESITVHNAPWYGSLHGHTLEGIVIAAADCMKVRKDIFETCTTIALNVKYLIDPRMSAETLSLYALDPRDKEQAARYAKTLYTNEEAVQERCTAKATIYTVNLLAGLVVKTLKNMQLAQAYPSVTHWSVDKSKCNMQAMSMTMYEQESRN